MVTQKFYSDRFHLNSVIAQIVGVETRMLNRWETELLLTLRFQLLVDESEACAAAKAVAVRSSTITSE